MTGLRLIHFATWFWVLVFPFIALSRETVEDAARIARQLVDNSPSAIGVIATNFPDDHSDLPGEPFALQEYYGSCFSNGSMALLMVTISQSTKNIFSDSNPGRNATIAVQKRDPSAALPRVALMGTVSRVESGLFEAMGVEDCYVSSHPDAQSWVPSKWGYHSSFWARFEIHAIYFVGGFGGLHYIGYIPTDLYASASSESAGNVNPEPTNNGAQHRLSDLSDEDLLRFL